ncbi:MAG: hypothetical protein ACKVP7_10920 [Hyphomicrobiaceae bacterium]
MRTILRRAGVAAIALAGLSLAAAAQNLPLPGQPAPPSPPAPFEAKADCTDKGVKQMEQQLGQLEAIEKTAPETIELVCDGVRLFSDWMGWKDDEPLPSVINDLAKKFLHQNVTPRMLKAMCRQAQGEAMRNFRTEIGQLKDKLASCKGI